MAKEVPFSLLIQNKTACHNVGQDVLSSKAFYMLVNVQV